MSEWMIERSVESGDPATHAQTAQWLLTARRVVGGVEARGSLRVRFEVGQGAPRHWHHLGTMIHSAPEIGVTRRQRTLTLCSDLCGGTELFDLEGDVDVAALLVRAAMLWLARDRSSTTLVFAELPGMRELRGGSSSFAVSARHSRFFNEVLMPFMPRDGFPAIGNAGQHAPEVAGLLPRHPLYVAMLPPWAQREIGHAAVDTAHWQDAFEGQGLLAGRTVSVLDAGPVHEGSLRASPVARAAAWRDIVEASTAAAAEERTETALVIDGDGDRLHPVRGRVVAGVLEIAAHEMPPFARAGDRVWCALAS